MRLCDCESKIIQKRLAINDKAYYAPIVSGFIEIETYKFMQSEGFNLLTLPELSVSYNKKKVGIIFELNGKQFELNASNAMRLSAMSSIYNKVFSVPVAFRYEEYADNIHLSEYKILEAEWKSSSEDELFSFIEKYLGYIIKRFNQYIFDRKLNSVFDEINIDFPIARITYDEVQNKFKVSGSTTQFNNFKYVDLNISPQIVKPYFVTYYPQKCSWRAKAKDSRLAYAYNLVMPNGYGELAEFSVRETSFSFYENKFKALGISDYYEWYMLSIKTDESPRIGFGLGLERLCSWLMQLDNICDTLCFPRDAGIFKKERI